MYESEEVFEAYCPNCKKYHIVEARMILLDYVKANILKSQQHELSIDWDTADISGDFEYVCQECGTLLGSSLEELEQKVFLFEGCCIPPHTDGSRTYCWFCDVDIATEEDKDATQCLECIYHESHKDVLDRWLKATERNDDGY